MKELVALAATAELMVTAVLLLLFFGLKNERAEKVVPHIVVTVG